MSSCLFHSDGQSHGQSDGQIDMTELIVAFRNFANEPVTRAVCRTNRHDGVNSRFPNFANETKKATGNAHTFL
jgi:hypothetical protein